MIVLDITDHAILTMMHAVCLILISFDICDK